MAQQETYDFKILSAVMEVNQAQKNKLVEKITDYFGADLQGKKIALWGLAFKPETDDIREAPSIQTIHGLLDQGAQIRVFDPEAMDNIKTLFGDRIEYSTDQL